MKKTTNMWGVFSGLLEDRSLEELIEEFDITPEDILVNAFDSGLIDPDDIDRLTGQVETDEDE